jgi:prepilin-type N-terminal cleavage/methylation domain-containing protein
MRRARGFTLIELMIALALAGMVVGGALQLHIAFNRQSQRQQSIAEIQQTLRVSMQILEKAIRTAGQGLPLSHSIAPFTGGVGCSPTYYGFQWSNANAYADPPGSYYTAGANADTDPDWFRIIASDTIGDTGATLQADTATTVSFYGVPGIAQSWKLNDLFVVIPDAKTDPVVYAPPNCTQTYCNGKAYQVTSAYAGIPTQATPGSVGIATSSCWNPTAASDVCLGGARAGCAQLTSQLRKIPNGGTVYRILDKNDTNFPQTFPNTPKLVMSTMPFGTAASAMAWTVLADNVEDMQIALILKDGTVCSWNDNPLTGCPFGSALAVRVTLVARSATPQGSALMSPTGGYEDEPQVTPASPDGYIRRAMTTTVILRNYSP